MCITSGREAQIRIPAQINIDVLFRPLKHSACEDGAKKTIPRPIIRSVRSFKFKSGKSRNWKIVEKSAIRIKYWKVNASSFVAKGTQRTETSRNMKPIDKIRAMVPTNGTLVITEEIRIFGRY